MKKILVVLLCFALFVGIGIRIWTINKDVNLPPVHTFEMGEEVAIEQNIFLDGFENMEGYTVTVKNAEIVSYDEFLEKYHYQESEENPLFEEDDLNFPEMVYDLHLTIKNTNLTEDLNEQKGISFLNYHLVGTDFSLQISDPLYRIANPNLKTEIVEGFRLRPDSEMDFHLPFYFSPSSIIERIQVEDIMNDHVYLVVSLYPNQKQILIE